MARIAIETAQLWQQARATQAHCAIIWLHSVGEVELYWQSVLAEVKLPAEAGHCRWIWPRAKPSPSSVCGGIPMHQWFDTPEFPVCRTVCSVPNRPRRGEATKAVEEAVQQVHLVLATLEAEGLPSDRVVVAGFGQGAALALQAALRYPKPLAGGALLSGWVAAKEVVESMATESGRNVDFLWLHGARDAVVEAELAMEEVRTHTHIYS
eukprot:6170186-Amphidinium_carterae.1